MISNRSKTAVYGTETLTVIEPRTLGTRADRPLLSHGDSIWSLHLFPVSILKGISFKLLIIRRIQHRILRIYISKFKVLDANHRIITNQKLFRNLLHIGKGVVVKAKTKWIFHKYPCPFVSCVFEWKAKI